MSNKQCSACEDLRVNAPDFVINGLGDDECENLSNNRGLAGNSDDCTDLHDMNDCLVGYMEDEIDAYETCDWKKYMKEFVPNVWTVFKGIICAICGIWCKLEAMNSGIDLTIGEDETDDSYIVAGRGVSFLTTGDADNDYTSDIKLENFGNFVRVNGSVDFRDSAFTEPRSKESWNFDNMDEIRKTNARKGYNVWHHTNGTTENLGPGGELIYEIRIKKSAYPAVKTIVSGVGGPTGGGAYQTNFAIFDGDDIPEGWEHRYAYGQHHRCNEATGVGIDDGSDGHIVEPGWIYIQHRMVNISVLSASGNEVNKYTPRGWCAIRLNMDGIEC